MLFVCGDCDTPIVFPYRFAVPDGHDSAKALLTCTRCGATYEVTVRQAGKGNASVLADVVKERKARRVLDQKSHRDSPAGEPVTVADEEEKQP